jgi:nucleoside-diphosphate-sugar epimerase/uncharacterized membrane protein
MSPARPVVLVTGLGGRIGSALAEALGEAYTLVGFELRCAEDSAHCIEADITSDESLKSATDTLRKRHGSHIASVIHLAAYYDFSGRADPKYDEVNVRGTERLLRALQAFEVEQFIYASTMLVHAPTRPGVPITEDSPLEPRWPYPQSKVAAERAVQASRGAIPALIFRIAGVYTDDCEVPSLAYQIQRIYEREMQSRVFPGNVAHGQAFVHLEDLAQAFRLALERRGALAHEQVLLIGEPVTESYEALQNLIAQRIHGEAWPTHDIPKTVAAAGAWLQHRVEDIVPDAIDRGIEPFIQPFMVRLADDHYELDISRAREALGWEPRRTLRGTLPEMIERLKKRPADWYRTNRIPVPQWLEQALDIQRPAGPLVEQVRAEMAARHRNTLWCHFANAGLGLWLMSSPFILQPGDWRMAASDVLAGFLVFVFGLLSLSRDAGWARWAVAALGMWLLFAPLAFWTPSAAVYANDTLVGALLIAFAVAIPDAPGVSLAARAAGPDVPPGWDYNPSSMTQRIPIVALAFIGLFISRYLAAYQLGHTEAAWDPFFGDGTGRIITSEVSQAWPVPDAGLGAMVYVLEIITGLIGGRRRWRTMPWLVLFFGFLIVPLGVTSIVFIIIQPIVIGTWCTLCLVAAAAMLLQVPYAFDEMLACVQFLKERRRQGRNLWYVFWCGDSMEGGRPEPESFERPWTAVVRDMVGGGVNVPRNLAASALIGAALMLTRLLFGTEAPAAHSDHLVGALVITVSVIAFAEMARPVRLLNLGFGGWLMIAPALLEGYTGLGMVASFAAGIVLVLLALPAGRIDNHYGAWDRIVRSERDPMRRLQDAMFGHR